MKTIRELRTERGQSENQLAEASGVPHQDVVEWERGTAQPPGSRLRALAAHFGGAEREIDLNPNHPNLQTDR